MNLNYYKQYEDVLDPKFSTEGAACFDIHAYLKPGTVVKCYDENNEVYTQTVSDVETSLIPGLEFLFPETNPANSVIVPSGSRVMIPTGIILDIPKYFSVRVHSRSSLALKQGLRLANSEGIIDYDYVDPLYIVMHNTSKVNVVISNGNRIAQCELIPMLKYQLQESTQAPEAKTDRIGGFGSTGQ